MLPRGLAKGKKKQTHRGITTLIKGSHLQVAMVKQKKGRHGSATKKFTSFQRDTVCAGLHSAQIYRLHPK